MKKIFLILCIFTFHLVRAQNTFRAIIKDEQTNAPIIGANAFIAAINKGATTDSSGKLKIENIPGGKFTVKFSFVGYENKEQQFSFPLANPDEYITIQLEESATELREIVVSTTRSIQNIENIPTRIDFLPPDEIEDKTTLRPGDIKMLLGETSGIAAQQTSAVSGTANFRIQGLDGQYTQLLKDGLPLYQGFSEGLSVVQIPPLDLKQVETIKGSASTLYGGGAIAGLINLISKTPQDKRELTLQLNGTTAKGFDGGAFYSQKWKKIGATLLGLYDFNAPYDPANIGLTAIPQTNRFTLDPKLFFWFNEKTSGWFGVNTTYEDRFGGDLKVIEGEADSIHQYFEHNKTFRLSTQLSITHELNEESKVNLKNSVSYFDRNFFSSTGNFHGKEISSFSEFNFVNRKEKSEWITGINLWTENFRSIETSNFNYYLTTIGVFAQNTFRATRWFSLETGLRVDDNSPAADDKLNGVFILPRVNVLIKFSDQWASRIGGGLGYKMPSPFNEEADQEGYENIQPISFSSTKAEKSYGVNGDVNFKNSFGEFDFTGNQLFFFAYLNSPLILSGDSFVNAKGFIDSKGAETNITVALDEWKVYLAYTYTDARQHFNGGNMWQPLTAKHRLSVDFTYELENNFTVGMETFYVSKQKLSDDSIGRGYILFGLLFEKYWSHLSAYINAENFTDRRQTRWEAIYTGTITDPVFRDIYAPLDGIIVNAGIKLRL